MAKAFMLPEAKRGEINAHLRKLSAVNAELDRMERCGIECQQLRELAKWLHDQFSVLKREYFPKGP